MPRLMVRGRFLSGSLHTLILVASIIPLIFFQSIWSGLIRIIHIPNPYLLDLRWILSTQRFRNYWIFLSRITHKNKVLFGYWFIRGSICRSFYSWGSGNSCNNVLSFIRIFLDASKMVEEVPWRLPLSHSHVATLLLARATMWLFHLPKPLF